MGNPSIKGMQLCPLLTAHKWDDTEEYTSKHLSERLPDIFFTNLLGPQNNRKVSNISISRLPDIYNKVIGECVSKSSRFALIEIEKTDPNAFRRE